MIVIKGHIYSLCHFKKEVFFFSCTIKDKGNKSRRPMGPMTSGSLCTVLRTTPQTDLLLSRILLHHGISAFFCYYDSGLHAVKKPSLKRDPQKNTFDIPLCFISKLGPAEMDMPNGKLQCGFWSEL